MIKLLLSFLLTLSITLNYFMWVKLKQGADTKTDTITVSVLRETVGESKKLNVLRGDQSIAANSTISAQLIPNDVLAEIIKEGGKEQIQEFKYLIEFHQDNM
mgnify:CR=1 FL=1